MSPSTSSFGRGLLGSLTRSKLYHSLTSLDKTKMWSKFYVDDEENVQRVLDAVSTDQKVITNPRLNRKRRTVIVSRNDGQPFGFTIQSYVLKRNDEDIPEKVSYIDYVQLESPAAEAGIRAGDVIISVNGRVVTGMSHHSLIELIGSCREMRMVLIFENIRQRIELAARAIRLRKLLHDKLYQLNQIDLEEQKILSRVYARSQSTLAGKSSVCGSLSSAGTSSGSSFKSSSSRTLRSSDATSSESTFSRSSQAGVQAGVAPAWELSSVPRPGPENELEAPPEIGLEPPEPPGSDGAEGSACAAGYPPDMDIDCLDMDVDYGSDMSGSEDEADEDGDSVTSSMERRQPNGRKEPKSRVEPKSPVLRPPSTNRRSYTETSRHPSLESTVRAEVSAVIDSVAFQHVLRLEDGDDDSVHITKL